MEDCQHESVIVKKQTAPAGGEHEHEHSGHRQAQGMRKVALLRLQHQLSTWIDWIWDLQKSPMRYAPVRSEEGHLIVSQCTWCHYCLELVSAPLKASTESGGAIDVVCASVVLHTHCNTEHVCLWDLEDMSHPLEVKSNFQ